MYIDLVPVWEACPRELSSPVINQLSVTGIWSVPYCKIYQSLTDEAYSPATTRTLQRYSLLWTRVRFVGRRTNIQLTPLSNRTQVRFVTGGYASSFDNTLRQSTGCNYSINCASRHVDGRIIPLIWTKSMIIRRKLPPSPPICLSMCPCVISALSVNSLTEKRRLRIGALTNNADIT